MPADLLMTAEPARGRLGRRELSDRPVKIAERLAQRLFALPQGQYPSVIMIEI